MTINALQRVFYHRYALKLRQEKCANARSGRRVLEGLLIQVDGGFGCLQPWPELGDPPLETHWQALRQGRLTPLLERTLAAARTDAEARRAGRSLFENLAVPDSHATVSGPADFAALKAVGFRCVKIKGRKLWQETADQVRAAAAAGLRVRIDFNGCLEPTEFLKFAGALQDLCKVVDFVEDPVPWNSEVWENLRKSTGWRLALDRVPAEQNRPPQQAAEAFGGDGRPAGYDVRILKPAVEKMDPSPVPVVITSNMDHPLGQAMAAWEAGRFTGQIEGAGLMTHHLFEPDEFSERLAASGPAWQSPGGTGFGFDDLLQALPWVPVQPPDKTGSRRTLAGTARQEIGDPMPLIPETGRILQNPRQPLPENLPVLEPGQIGFSTSGSTGTPSIVVHTEASLQASALAVNDWIAATASDVWLGVLPEFHVGGFQIRVRAGLSGSRLVTAAGRWNPQDFVRLCQEEAVTLTSLVPAQVVDLVKVGAVAPAGLRAVIVGGGALDPAVARKAREAGWPLLLSYGSTEAASQIATQPLSAARPPSTNAKSGQPPPREPPLLLLPHWEARVRSTATDEISSSDPAKVPEKDCPAQAGLLELRGEAMAAGRFIWTEAQWVFLELTDPHGWWQSSDLVLLNGRELQFAARADRVVKVLGELVNVDSIEKTLAELGLPRGQFAVIAVPEPRLGMELVLVLETAEDHSPDAPAATGRTPDHTPAVQEVLRRYAAGAAPFARLARVLNLPVLPRSPLGKIQLATLRDLASRPLPQ